MFAKNGKHLVAVFMDKCWIAVVFFLFSMIRADACLASFYFSQGTYDPMTGTGSEVLGTGAGNVNNSAIGTDRTLVAEFDETGGLGAGGDSWIGIGFGHTVDVPGGITAPVGGLVRTGGAAYHQLFYNGSSEDASPAWTAGSHVRFTIDLAPGGIALGETATATFQIDYDSNGSYDVTLSHTFGWPGADNYVNFYSYGATEATHRPSNFVLQSVPEPASFAFFGIGLLGLIAPSIRKLRRQAGAKH